MVSQAEEGEVGERLEVGGERGTVRFFFLLVGVIQIFLLTGALGW